MQKTVFYKHSRYRKMISFDQHIIGLITLFEKLSGAKVKDCFEDGEITVFLLYPGERKKLKLNTEKIKAILKKNIRILEFHPNPRRFLQVLLFPDHPEIIAEDTTLFIKTKDSQEKGHIYGRERSKLRRIEQIMQRYFKVTIVVQ